MKFLDLDKNRNILILVVLVAVLGIVLGVMNPVGSFFDSNDSTSQGPAENETSAGGNGDNGEEVSLSVFSEEGSWSSSDGWERTNSNLHQTYLEDGKVVLDEGQTFGHLGLKFMKNEFDKVVLETNIDNPDTTGVELYVGTSQDEVAAAQLKYDKDLYDKEMYQIEDGENEIPLDGMSWSNFTFFKIRLERASTDYESPELLNVEIS
ncbi:MAG: hypothetical protein ACLFQ8_01490 [Candidatus Aenigmatarchaeota archaeon]